MSPPAKRRTRFDDGENQVRNRFLLAGVLSLYAAVGAGLLVLASHLHGVLRYVVGAIGLIGIGLFAIWTCALILLVLGWGFFTTTFREQPSVLQWIVWSVCAVALGAVAGAGAYSVGPVALLGAPLVTAIVYVVLKQSEFASAYASRRLVWFLGLAAIISIPIGSTIFL